MDEHRDSAFGRGGWFWEGLGDGMRGLGNGVIKGVMWVAVIVLLGLAARWLWTEYYITTHCTMVLGTRVCQ